MSLPRKAKIIEVRENETFIDNWGRSKPVAPFCIVLDETGDRHNIMHSQSVGGIPSELRKVDVTGTLTYRTGSGFGLWFFEPDRNNG